jgi:hypothetical protein
MVRVVCGTAGACTVCVAGLPHAARVNAAAINTTKTKWKVFMMFSLIFLLHKRF